MKLSPLITTLLCASLVAQLAAKEHALPDPLEAGWEGKPVCEKLHEDSKQRVLRCTFAPGVGHEKHFHAPHFGYALSGGRMQLKDANGVRIADLSAGSSFNSNGTDWHEVVNVGTTTVQYLIVEVKETKQTKDAK